MIAEMGQNTRHEGFQENNLAAVAMKDYFSRVKARLHIDLASAISLKWQLDL